MIYIYHYKYHYCHIFITLNVCQRVRKLKNNYKVTSQSFKVFFFFLKKSEVIPVFYADFDISNYIQGCINIKVR